MLECVVERVSEIPGEFEMLSLVFTDRNGRRSNDTIVSDMRQLRMRTDS